MKSDNEIISILRSRIARAVNEEGGEISKIRQRSLNEYRGTIGYNDREGYSQYIDRTTFEQIEWAMPAILRPFVADERVVEFEPREKQDEEQAEQETDIVNYYALERNNGFQVAYTFLKEVLLNPTAYCKVYEQRRLRRATETYADVTLEQAAELEQQGLQLLEASEPRAIEIGTDPQMGLPIQAEVIDLKVRREWEERKKVWKAVPADEILIDDDADEMDVDELEFVCHRMEKSFTQLVNEGFDPVRLEQTASENFEATYNDERTNRHNTVDDYPDHDSNTDRSLRKYTVYECYCWIDTDNDGVAEQRSITFIGNTVFFNEEIDYQPIVACSAILNPHRHVGMSLAEAVADLQEYSTKVKRALLDNANQLNTPRQYVGEAALDSQGLTLPMLLDINNTYIPVGDPNAIQAQQHQSIIQELIPAIQQLEQDRRLRTGISPEMDLNPDVLQGSTAAAFIAAKEQASQRIEMIARIFAEVGMKKVFQKFHTLMRLSPEPETAVRIRGRYVNVNSADWRERPDVKINVGLGFAAKQDRIMMQQQLLQVAQQAAQYNLVGPEQGRYALVELVKAMGLKDHDLRFLQIDQIPPPPDPKESPEYQALMAQAQEFLADAEKQLTEAKAREDEVRLKEQDLEGRLEKMAAEVRNLDAKTVNERRAANSGG